MRSLLTIGLPAVIIISVLMFGSVEDWSVAITGCLIIIMFNIWMLRKHDDFIDAIERSRQAFYAIIAFIALVVLQLSPMPIAILKLLSPGKAELIAFFSLQGYHPVSTNPYATIHAFVKFAFYCMVFLMAVAVSKDSDKMLTAIRSIVIFGFLLSIFALIQNATGNGEIYWFRELTEGGSYFGPFVNKNHFAGFIGMVIPLSIGVSMIEKQFEKKILYAFFSAIMSFSLFYSLSRGGIIGLFVSLVVIIFFTLRAKGSSRQIMTVVIVVAVLVSYLSYFGFDRIIDRFASDDLSLAKRVLIWKSILMSATGKYWFMGSGLGSFPSLSPLYHPEGISSYFDHAHNDYLEYMIETGIIGFALFFVALDLFIRKIIRSGISDDQKKWIAWSSIASLSSIAVHSIVDFNLHITSNALMVVLIMGILYGCIQSKSCNDSRGQYE